MRIVAVPELVSILSQRGKSCRHQVTVRVQVVISGAASYERAAEIEVEGRLGNLIELVIILVKYSATI